LEHLPSILNCTIWSRATSTKEFYVAGGEISPLANGMATAADWMSAAFQHLWPESSLLMDMGAVYLMGWTDMYYLPFY
jgi:cation/acetate symporter